MLPAEIPNYVYESFSFKEGGQPDFETLLSYFLPQGLFINNKGDSPRVRSLQEFVAFMKGNIDAGDIISICESEIDNTVAIFGKVGHIVSRYKLEAETPNGLQTRYGVNLFQMIKSGEVWKISSMCWDDYEDQRLINAGIGEPNS